jgi:uncharacterized membrane protein YfcA
VLVYAHAEGGFAWSLLVPLAVGFSLGALTGARLAWVVSPAALGRGFAVLLAATAVGLLLRGGA